MRNLAKGVLLPWIFDVTGGSVLNRDELVGLGINVVNYAGESRLKIPPVQDSNVPDGEFINGEEIIFPPTNIFRLDYKTHGDCLKRYDSIVLNGKRIVMSGVDANLAKLASLFPDVLNGKMRREDVILAPWPHRWSTYGDFMNFGLPKLARLWDALTPAERDKAVISFPFSMGNWAREYAELIGIPADRLVDSCKESIGLSASGVLIAGDGPNLGLSLAHPQDIATLRRFLHQALQDKTDCSFKKLYVQRSGRRKILNEDEFIPGLRDLGFEILEDKPRSVAEQLRIFRHAELVAGAHGSGLCNSIMSRNKVSIIEAKSSNWDYSCRRYFSAMIDSEYWVLYDRRFGSDRELRFEKASNDILLNPDRLLSVARTFSS